MKTRFTSIEPITSAVCWFQWLTGMWERLCNNILLCVCSGQERRWTIGAQGPIKEADRPNLWPPEKRRYQLRKVPVVYNSQEAPHPPSHSAYIGFSSGPGLALPLLCRRPCFRPLWSPSDGGAPTPVIQQACVAALGNSESTNNRNDIFLATLNKYP